MKTKYRADDGTYTAADGGSWLPGVFQDERTVDAAFEMGDATLQRLQDEANKRAGGTGGVIQFADLSL